MQHTTFLLLLALAAPSVLALPKSFEEGKNSQLRIRSFSAAPQSLPSLYSSAHSTTASSPDLALRAVSAGGLPANGLKKGNQDSLSAQDYADISVYHHNIHRRNHSSPDVVWDADLAAKALQKAQKCDGTHNLPAEWGPLGSNLAGSSFTNIKPGNGGVSPPNPSGWISNLFYNREMPLFPKNYGGKINESNWASWGHFSQVVWPKTTKIACASSRCIGGWFGVCLYSPPGNYVGQYSIIGAPKGQPTVCGNDGC